MSYESGASAYCWDGVDCSVDSCDPDVGCNFDSSGCCSDDASCGGGQVCVDGSCHPAASASDYGFPRPATWIHSMAVGGAEGQPPCCFDFDGDGEMDNAYGELTDGLAGLFGDISINQAILDAIMTGESNLLLSYAPGVPAALPNVPSLAVDMFMAADNGTPYADKLAGLGQWTLPESGFEPGTAVAAVSMLGSVSSGELAAGPGNALPPTMPPSAAGGLIGQQITFARIEATMQASGTGVTISSGRLGGMVPMSSAIGGFNEFIADNCGCLGLSGPMIDFFGDDPANKPKCNKAPASTITCSTTPEEVCQQLNSFCGTALLFMEPDADLDGNGYPDAMSVGFWFEGVATEVVGIAP